MAEIYNAAEKKHEKKLKKVHPSKSSFKSRSKARKERLNFVLKDLFALKAPDSPGGLTASFCYYPENVNFINKDPEEEIILLVRRHPITNLSWILTALLIVILPAFLSVFPFFEMLPMGFQFVSLLIWYMIFVAYVLEKYLSWFYHVNIITDERIIEVDFHNLIYREMTDASIENIEDVTVQIGGGIRTFFNYGDIVIQTAAQIPQVTFEAVARPDMVAKVLRELRVEEEQEKIEGRVR